MHRSQAEVEVVMQFSNQSRQSYKSLLPHLLQHSPNSFFSACIVQHPLHVSVVMQFSNQSRQSYKSLLPHLLQHSPNSFFSACIVQHPLLPSICHSPPLIVCHIHTFPEMCITVYMLAPCGTSTYVPYSAHLFSLYVMSVSSLIYTINAK